VDAASTSHEAITKVRETSFHAAMINTHLEAGDASSLPNALKRIQPEIACVVINRRAYCPNSIQPREMLALTRRLLRQQERSERDHTIAEYLQAGFLPPALPRVEGWEIAAHYEPAIRPYRVGGDFYDVFSLPGDQIGMAVGDVTGKGLIAAAHTAMARNFLRAYAFESSDPAAVLARLDAALHAFTPEEVFVSLVFAVLDPREGGFRWANAGHEAPMLLAASGLCTRLTAHSLVLGVEPGGAFRVHEATMAPGDLLLFYTDGATDAWELSGQRGVDRLEQVLRHAADRPTRKVVHTLARAVETAAGTHIVDDVCFLAIKRSR
jgi:serine phosphatase RsbU (regulator of sigma subunit)